MVSDTFVNSNQILLERKKSWIIKNNRTRKNWKCDGIRERDDNDWDYMTGTMQKGFTL